MKNDDISEEDWEEYRQCVEKLYDGINREVQCGGFAGGIYLNLKIRRLRNDSG